METAPHNSSFTLLQHSENSPTSQSMGHFFLPQGTVVSNLPQTAPNSLFNWVTERDHFRRPPLPESSQLTGSPEGFWQGPCCQSESAQSAAGVAAAGVLECRALLGKRVICSVFAEGGIFYALLPT